MEVSGDVRSEHWRLLRLGRDRKPKIRGVCIIGSSRYGRINHFMRAHALSSTKVNSTLKKPIFCPDNGVNLRGLALTSPKP